MIPSDGPKDLLGRTIRRKRPKYEAALERHEISSVPERAERIRWLSSVMPQNRAYMMPLESFRVFQEAKDCFVYGHFVATMVLAASFVEHWLAGLISAQGQKKIAGKGLAAIIDHCRDNQLLPSVVCDKVDSLRQKRNPFVHLKAFDHPHGLGQRMLSLRAHPDVVLEADAKDALVAMYSVAVYAKRQL
jgi:hypothetical protein